MHGNRAGCVSDGFFLCELSVFAVKVRKQKSILTAKTQRAPRSTRYLDTLIAFLPLRTKRLGGKNAFDPTRYF